MENNVVRYHLITLEIIRRLFEKISENKYLNIDLLIEYMMVIRILKSRVNKYYIETISTFKEEQNIKDLYNLFILNVMLYQLYLENNKDLAKAKKMKVISINSLDKSNQELNKKEYNELEKCQIELNSYKKKENTKKHLQDILNKQILKYKRILYIVFILIVLFSLILCFIYFSFYNDTIKDTILLSKRIKSNIILKKIYNNIRLMSISGAAEREEYYNYYNNNLLSLQDKVKNIFIPRFKTIEEQNTYPLIMSTNSVKTYSYETAYEFSMFLESYLKTISSYKFEDWKITNTAESLFNIHTYKNLIDNFKNNFNKIMDATLNIELTNFMIRVSKFKVTWVIFNAVLLILTISFCYLIIKPVAKTSKKIFDNSFKSFKTIPQGSIEEIINNLQKDEKLLSKTYDINPDYTIKELNNIKGDIEDSNEKYSIITRKKLYNKIQLIAFSFIFIIVIFVIQIPFLLKIITIEDSTILLYMMSSEKTSIYNTCAYSYETIIQDRATYFPGEVETYLSNNLETLIIYSNILFKKSDSVSLIEFDVLNNYLYRNMCKDVIDGKCDEYNQYTDLYLNEHHMGSPINNIIFEYLTRASALLDKHEIKYNKEVVNIEKIYDKNNNVQNNAKEIFNEILENPNLKYLNVTTDYIINSLEHIEDTIIEDLSNTIKSKYYPLL
ncbi:hypothetical protein BCR32DRAFT_273133, partial [Anaeromyces robustus]